MFTMAVTLHKLTINCLSCRLLSVKY